MRNVLLLAPTGTISINPNLGAIVKLLCDDGFQVDIVSLERSYQQNWNYPNSRLFVCKNGSFDSNLEIFNQFQARYDLIIGVDEAIISASFIAETLKAPLAFISYEILFSDEAGSRYKRTEIEACRNVSFAIAQDRVRGFLVAQEYGIPPEKIIAMPVSDGQVTEISNKDLLRKHFRIPIEKKIALFCGAVSKRSMIDDLLGTVKDWNDEWVLVLHSYSGFSQAQIKELKSRYDTPKIYYSDMVLKNTEDVDEVIASADLGIAFFTPSQGSLYECKNMLFMGLGSGKFAMYLKNGLPVMINEVGEMSDLVRRHDLGLVVNSKTEMDPGRLSGVDMASARERCRKVYSRYLDFNLFAGDLLEAVNNSVEGKEYRCRNCITDGDYLSEHLGYINQVTYWFNESYRRSLNCHVNNFKVFVKGVIGHKSNIMRLDDSLKRYFTQVRR